MISLITIILNDAPYGSERAYNGLRVALALLKQEKIQVNVFLLADATFCALKEQTTPDGYYNIGRLVRRIGKQGKIKGAAKILFSCNNLNYFIPQDSSMGWII